jgi:hypothetical protein
MKTLHKLLLATTLLALGIPTAQAQTTTFDFHVVFDANTQTDFNTAFGAGTAGFTGAGLYEETNTATKTVVQVGSGLSSAPIALNTVFAQNSSPSNQLAFTSFGTNPSQIFPGFALSNVPPPPPPAATWQYVQTLTTTSPPSFVDEVGGAATPFSLNSIGLANLQSGPSISVTIEGFLGGSMVASQTFNPTAVGGNGNTGVPASVNIFALTAPGFGDVDKIEVLPSSANANVNDITIGAAAVPEPSPWSMIAVGGVALVGVMLRKKHRIA